MCWNSFDWTMSVAYAAGEAGAGANGAAQQPSMIESMIPLLFIFLVMYFIMIRPQAKKAREHANLLSTMKAGDEVVTSGGIIGRVKSVADEFVLIDVGQAQLKIVKDHVSRISKSNGAQVEKAVKASK